MINTSKKITKILLIATAFSCNGAALSCASAMEDKAPTNNKQIAATKNRATNSSYSNLENLTFIEKTLYDFLKTHKKDERLEEIYVDSITYRLSYVRGDNDCGIHTLNALFPMLNLTRQSILERYGQVLNDPQNSNHKLLKTELACDVVTHIRQAEMLDSVVTR